MTKPTFEQFQASRTDCADIGAIIGEEMNAPDGTPVSGLLYLNSLWIEKRQDWWTPKAKARGAYFLILERDNYISDELESLERKLFDWANAYGYFDDPMSATLRTREAIRAAIALADLPANARATLEMLLNQRGCEHFDPAVDDGYLTTLCDLIVFG